MTKLDLDFLGAQVLRQKFTDEELEKLGLLPQVKHQYELTDKFCRYTVVEGLHEGSFGAGVFQFYAIEIPDYFIDLLLSPPNTPYKDSFRRELIDLYTGMGIMLAPSVIEKLRQLPLVEQDYLEYAIKRNQDYEVWKAETEEHLKKGEANAAFYRIRNLPAFSIYKDQILALCKEKNDYETLALICYQRHIYLPELRDAAEELLKQGKTGFALAALFVLRDDKKMEEVARQLA